MSLFGLFNSSTSSNQTAYNQQVGADAGGAAIGAGASNNRISIMTADPKVAEAAIEGNAYVAKQAFDFGQASLELAGTSAALSIAGANQLAGSFLDQLQKSYRTSTQFASASLTAATQAEQAALAASNELVSHIIDTQTPGGAALAVSDETQKTQLGTVLIVGLGLLALVWLAGR